MKQNAARKIPVLDAKAYKMIMNEQALNSGSAMFNFDDMKGLADTDWIDAMLKKDAQTKNCSLSIDGGSETSVYAISLNCTGQEGIVDGNDFFIAHTWKSQDFHVLLRLEFKI